MSASFSVLLPQTVLMCAACLFFLGGTLSRTRRLWGPLCLLTLMLAAGCLLNTTGRWTRTQPPDSAAVARPEADAAPGRIGSARSTVVQDSFSIAFHWVSLGLGFLMTLSAFGAQRDSDVCSEHFGLLLLSLSGLLLISVANDLIVLFVALELVAVPIWVLLFLQGSDTIAREAATKQLLMSVLSSAILLYGFSFLYGLTGSTNFTAIRGVLAASYTYGDARVVIGSGSRLGVVAMVLVFAGLGFRLSLVPFHFGTPDIYQGTTAWNAGLLAVVSKAAGFVALLRVLNGTMAGFESTGELTALVLAGVTMSVGNMMALFETNIRRILAYTTMAHTGFALIGVTVGFCNAAHPQQSLAANTSLPGGIAASLFYLGGYVLMTTGLFAVLVYLARRDRQIEYVEDLAGLIHSERWVAICALIFLLGLAGVPPLLGFWGRFLLLASTLSVQAESASALLPLPNPGFVVLAMVALLNVLMTAAVYLRMATVMFLDRQISRPQPSGGLAALTAAVLAAVLSVGIGLLPGPVLGYLDEIKPSRAISAHRADTSKENEAVIDGWHSAAVKKRWHEAREGE